MARGQRRRPALLAQRRRFATVSGGWLFHVVQGLGTVRAVRVGGVRGTRGPQDEAGPVCRHASGRTSGRACQAGREGGPTKPLGGRQKLVNGASIPAQSRHTIDPRSGRVFWQRLPPGRREDGLARGAPPSGSLSQTPARVARKGTSYLGSQSSRKTALRWATSLRRLRANAIPGNALADNSALNGPESSSRPVALRLEIRAPLLQIDRLLGGGSGGGLGRLAAASAR
jgi:hypothetical protein